MRKLIETRMMSAKKIVKLTITLPVHLLSLSHAPKFSLTNGP